MIFARVVVFVLALGALAGAVGAFLQGGFLWIGLGVALALLCLLLLAVARLLGDPQGTVERLAARRSTLEERTGRTSAGASPAPVQAPADPGAAEPMNRAERRAAERAARRRGNDASS